MSEKATLPPASPAHSPAQGSKGLEDVVIGPTTITFLDGLKGRMIYRGYNALDLAEKVSFEEVVHLLWEGDLPTRTKLDAFSKQFLPHRALPAEVLDHMRKFPAKSHPMDALRTALGLLALYDPDNAENTPDASRRKAVRLVARLATLTAVWDRIRKGLPVVEPDPTLGHSANFLYMLTGKRPDLLDAQALDLYLNLLADHDLNASTFSARVVTSTQSDIYSAVTAALGALKGSLHGGANEKAMEMFIEIGDESRAVAYVEKAVAEKRKIMGFGHRVYKVEDPRSGALKAMLLKVSQAKKQTKWYDISLKVAETVRRLKSINTNVDFYSASLLYLIGIPIDLFTPVFAVSRIAGWTAHYFEQSADNRLIRPRTEYVGAGDRAVLPIDQRR